MSGIRIGIDITGLDELRHALDRVGKTLTDAELQEDLMDAAVPLRDLAQAKAPRRASGSQSGYQEVGIFPVEGEPAVNVGATRDAFYLNFQELGTGPRVRKSGGRTGSLPARPWLRPAADESEDEVSQRFSRTMGRKIEMAGRG